MILAIDSAGPRVALASGNAKKENRTLVVEATLNHNEILSGRVAEVNVASRS